jgi:hypothetical protein
MKKTTFLAFEDDIRFNNNDTHYNHVIDHNTTNSKFGSTPNKQYLHRYYQNRILSIKDFDDAFELVRNAVDSKFNMHRAGLSLILQTLPTQLGAYHLLGSNMIIMNKRLLDIIKSKKTSLDYNSYVFMVLCHEYLHSFGIIDEQRVRKMTYDLCIDLLGTDHPATLMAKHQPWDIFPELKAYQSDKFENGFEIIKKFDTSTQSYIS